MGHGERTVRVASAKLTDAKPMRADMPTGTGDERRVPETWRVSAYSGVGYLHVSSFLFVLGIGGRKRGGRNVTWLKIAS